MSTNTTTSDFIAYPSPPSLALGTTFLTLFTLTTLLHLYQLFRTRSLYLIPLLLGALFEVIGYTARTISATETYPNYSLGPYIIQALLILVAPVLIAASVYVMLGKIITATNAEDLSPLQPRKLSWLFVGGDLVTFMVQSTGAGMLAQKDVEKGRAGRWIVIGGLALQLIVFGGFIVVAGLVGWKLWKQGTPASRGGMLWRRHWGVLVGVSGLITVRSVYRVVEYIMGDKGALMRVEAWGYGFDAAVMLLVLVLLNVVHPSQMSGLLSGRGGIVWGFLLRGKRKTGNVEEGAGVAGCSDVELLDRASYV